ncbi:MAG TPA: hypothetical protein VG227_03925 [Caulobacteraceae bacterium]|jgi:hypothetical protein|nr:hypothetical protein [Caulobacteraceae bacterium]
MNIIILGASAVLALSTSTSAMGAALGHGRRVVAPPCAHVPSLAVGYLSVTNLGSKKNPRLGVIYVAAGGRAKEQMTEFTMPRRTGQTVTYKLYPAIRCIYRPEVINH